MLKPVLASARRYKAVWLIVIWVPTILLLPGDWITVSGNIAEEDGLVRLILGGAGLLAILVATGHLSVPAIGVPGVAQLTCEEGLEPLAWVFQLPGVTWTQASMAWIWVTNHGKGSRFAVAVQETTGLPDSWGSYHVGEAAWDGKRSAITEIPQGHKRKLRLASVLQGPRGFWFWTSEGETEVPGWPWSLEDETADIGFVVVITDVNTGGTVRKRGRITIPLDPAEAEFTLEDA